MGDEPKTPQKPLIFLSDEGKARILHILKAKYDFHPHDHQLESTCAALDGKDVFGILPTGAGKTGHIYVLMMVAKAVSEEPTICPEKKFPKNPLIVVVCPTNYIEYQMEATMSRFNLKSVIINAETLQAAALAQPRIDLWKLAETENSLSIVILSPEQLVSSTFRELAESKSFQARIIALAIDEVHLLLTWGKSFRKSFTQIGFVRDRLPDNVVQIALTATMPEGPSFASVCKFLHMQPGTFQLIRRSNIRYDIQIIYREILSPVNGKSFPELDWVLTADRIILIFCETIRFGFNVYRYLETRSNLNTGSAIGKTCIRLYNALNWASYNAKTRELLEEGKAKIVVCTSSMAVGVDVAGVQDVIIFGDPANENERLQMIGRIRPKGVGNHRGIVYFHPNSMERALAAVARTSKAKAMSKEDSENRGREMDPAVAAQRLAPCYIEQQNVYYGNSAEEPPCTCPFCMLHPPAPKPKQCNCSGCLPETPFVLPPKASASGEKNSGLPPEKQRLSNVMREYGKAQLELFRLELFKRADVKRTHIFPPSAFLSDADIKEILDHFAFIVDGVATVQQYVAPNSWLEDNHIMLQERLQDLWVEMLEAQKAHWGKPRASKRQGRGWRKDSDASGA